MGARLRVGALAARPPMGPAATRARTLTGRFAAPASSLRRDAMLKKIAVAFGVIFVVVGVLGYVPAFVTDGRLLGLFEVNNLHNLVHLVTGIIAIVVGVSSERASRMFFRIFGVIYALVALLGIYSGNEPVLGLIANNYADVGLHAVIAVVALYLGFAMKPRTPATA
jgi:hypothetical protein